MTIQVGDKLPHATFTKPGDNVIVQPPVIAEQKAGKTGGGEGFVDRIRNLFKDWL